MKIRTLPILTLGAVLITASSLTLVAQNNKFMSVDEIRPGMKGIGKTDVILLFLVHLRLKGLGKGLWGRAMTVSRVCRHRLWTRLNDILRADIR